MFSRSVIAPALFLSLSLGLAGCADSKDDDASLPVTTAKSSLARDNAPSLSEDERTSFAGDRADFGVDLFREVVREKANENALISPHSVSMALAMTYGGTTGETKTAMEKALRFNLAEARTHAAFNATDLGLASRQHDAKPDVKESGAVRLASANSLWAQSREGWEPSYLDTLATNYGSGIQLVDFSAGAGAPAAQTLNAWVSERTEKKIPELLDKGQVNGALWVMINAIYFKANWQQRFTKEATSDAPFHTAGGATVTVPTMRMSESLRAVHTDRFDAVELPYDGDQLAMVAILPKEGTFGSFVGSFTGRELLQLPLESQLVQLAMPKFGIKPGGDGDLTRPLQTLGLPTEGTFPNGADSIKIVQKTFLEADEAGTEAAAASAVIGFKSSAPVDPPKPLVVTLDRSFLYAIIDKPTGAVLFLGQVADPSSR